MGSDSGEPTRRKHHRSSSDEDVESGSKRPKHRQNHRHRHHRHRSDGGRGEGTTVSRNESEAEKVHLIEARGRKLEKNRDDDGGSLEEVLVMGGSGFQGIDYEMEEGEIVEDGALVHLTQDLEISEKESHSDVESGEIGMKRNDHSNMGVVEVGVGVHNKSMDVGKGIVDGKQSVDVGRETIVNSSSPVNGYCQKLSHNDDNNFFGDGKRTSELVVGVDLQSVRKFSSLEKRPRPVSPNHTRDKHMNETSYSSLSKSPEFSGGRSRSQSIAPETSAEDYYNIDGKQQSEFDNGVVSSHLKICPRNIEDSAMENGRKYNSSRYVNAGERYRNRDNHAYREGSRDRPRERERKMDEMVKERRSRHRDRDSRKREMLKDTGRQRERERERYCDQERGLKMNRDGEREKERDSVKDRVRERRIEDVDRSREGARDHKRDRSREGVRDHRRDRSRERARDHRRDRDIDKHALDERDGLSRHKKHDKDVDGYRYGDNESLHRRNSEYLKEKRSRSNLEEFTTKSKEEEQGNDKMEREGKLQEDYQEEIIVQLKEHEEDDLEKIKEESRRRRQAILEKHKNRQQQNEAQPKDTDKEQAGEPFAQVSNGEVIQGKHENQLQGKDISVSESSIHGVRPPLQNGVIAIPASTGTGGLGEGTPKSERSDDMFCDDIFGESPAEVRKPGKGDGLAIEKNGFHDNWDDPEGYYGHRFGEILDGRYEIIAAQGKGVFSTVVRAKDLKAKPCDPDEVAIKIIRNNETMYKAGMEELVILKKLVGADPEDRRHCVRFLSTFKYRNHLCLVFESLHMNLREVLKKFGRNIGLKLTAVRTYAKQLFIALKHLKNCGVLHCDIKPDNMLVNESKNVLKLCDFGSAMFAGKNEITPYLVSRFYRAPEIILGLPYDHPLDIWSVGCCLFELYTGKVLFPGATNNDMIRLHMELKGSFPKKMLRKAAFTDQHFDQDFNFLATEEDPVSKKAIRRVIVNTKPKDFGTLISGSPGEDSKMVAHFKDLMEKIFVLDPEKRLNVSQALNHPFITGK